MKNTLVTLFLITLMGVGNASASNASANAAAAPAPEAPSAAADVKRSAELGATQVAGSRASTLVKEDEGLKALPKVLLTMIKHYLLGTYRITNNQTDERNGLVVVKFLGTTWKIYPGQTVNLFAARDLDDLIKRFNPHVDKYGDAQCTISYYDPKKRRPVVKREFINKSQILSRIQVTVESSTREASVTTKEFGC